MNRNVAAMGVVLAAGLCWLVAPAWSEEKSSGDKARDAAKEAGEKIKDEAHKAAGDAMDKAKQAMGGKPGEGMPSEEEMQKMMAEMSRPTEHHEHLKQLEGSWDAKVRMRMAPEMPWEESKGSCENKMIMNGLWLQEDYRGDMGGQQFRGMGLMGYDKTEKRFVSIWLDNMSSAAMVSYGTCDESHKTLTMTGKAMCPMTQQMKAYRNVQKHIDSNKFVFEMYEKTGDQPEFQSMEITYTRR